MMRILVVGKVETEYEITVEASSPEEALSVARDAVKNGTRPEGLVEFWENQPHVDLVVEGHYP